MQNSGEDGRPYQVDTMSFLSIDSYTMLAFVRDVYANLAILCTVSIIQMLVVSLFKTKFSDVLPVPPFLWLVFAFAVLTLLNCTPRLRYKAPYNWVLAFITVECVTLFTLYFLFLEDWYVMMGCGVLAVLIVTLFTYWGSKGPKGCMPTAAVATVIVATALVGMFLFLVLSVLLNNLFILGLIFVLFILLVTVTIVQSELIHARMDYFPMGDQVGSAVTIFLCGWGVHSCFIFAIVVIKRAMAFDDQYKMHTIFFAT